MASRIPLADERGWEKAVKKSKPTQARMPVPQGTQIVAQAFLPVWILKRVFSSSAEAVGTETLSL
jgi:hypothetical protein